MSARLAARNNLIKALAAVVQALKRRDRKEPGWKEKEQAEERLAKIFQPIFDRQARLIHSRLLELDKTRPKEPKGMTAAMIQLLDLSREELKSFQLKLLPPGIFEGLDLTDAELDKIRSELFDTVYNGSGLFQDQTGYVLDVGLINKEAQSWAAAYSGELITKISETTREIVRETISDFVATPGMTIADAMGRMPFDPQRAQTIAVTEITRSYAQGNQIAGEVMKEQFPDVQVKKIWYTNNDDLVCEICGPLNGIEVGFDDSWDSDDGPMDNPPAHVNCRCWTQTTTDILAGEQPTPAPEPPPAPAPVPPPAPAPAPAPEPKPPKAPRKPGWMPGDPVPTFKTQAEAEKWFTKNRITKYANFGNLDLRVTQEIADSFGKNLSAFPKLKGRMRFVGSMQARAELQAQLIEKTIRQSIIDSGAKLTASEIDDLVRARLKTYRIYENDRAYAVSFSGFQYENMTGVVVNEKYGSSYRGMVKSLQHDIAMEFHPPGCGTPLAVMDHEIGHQIDDLLRLVGGSNRTTLKDPVLKSIWTKAKKGNMVISLSEYAVKNKAEFIAEAWSEYLNNPVPRETAQAVGDRIKAIYAEKYP